MIKNINFVSNFKKANIVSILIFILSLIFIMFKGLNYGIDFKGGTLIELRTDKSITASSIVWPLITNAMPESSAQHPRMAIAFVLNTFNSGDGGETFSRSGAFTLCSCNRKGRLNVETKRTNSFRSDYHYGFRRCYLDCQEPVE